MNDSSAFDDLDKAAQEAGITISRYTNPLISISAPAKRSTVPHNDSQLTASKQPTPSQQPKKVTMITPQWKQRMREEQEDEELHRALPLSERDRKAADLKSVVDTRLIPELERVMVLREKLQKEVDEFIELKRTASLLMANGEKSVSSRVDLGNGVYADARVPDSTRLMVEVGLGFFVEHTLPETLSWCDVKIEHINKRISKAETSSATLSARIKVLHDGIGQLLGVEPMEQKRRERESF